MFCGPAGAFVPTGPAVARRRRRFLCLAGPGLACFLVGGCGAPSSSWHCENHGAGRRCERPLPVLPGDGWDCWVAGGDLACGRPDWGAGGPGWSCGRFGAATVCRAAGAARPPEAAPDGWQGHVSGGRIVARWRRAGNAPWRCGGASCMERWPDRPSADEWECIEGDGRVLCRGRYNRGVDPRWRCVPLGGQFLCVDFDPDYPAPEDPTVWNCVYDDSTKRGRFCSLERRPLGRCPGLSVAGRCWPFDPTPGCWFDGDCPAGRVCRVGKCVVR